MPAHILRGVPVEELADDPFGWAPVGAGPYSLVELTEAPRRSCPPSRSRPRSPVVRVRSPPTDSLHTPGPTTRPDRPTPYLDGIELRFFSDPDELVAAYEAGDLDAASGLPRRLAADLAGTADTRLMRYPSATLTTVLLNLRPTHPEFRDPAVRTALLAAIDRAALIDAAFAVVGGRGRRVPSRPRPPLFDATADPPVKYSRSAARKALKAAKWTEKNGTWRLPDAKAALEIEVLSPDMSANPGALRRGRSRSSRTGNGSVWPATHVALPPGEFVTDHLATGEFQVAVADINVGLDPDLYPLLASQPDAHRRLERLGLQDLDARQAARPRRARRAPTRRARRRTRPSRSSSRPADTCSRWPSRDEFVVVRDTVVGPRSRTRRRPLGPILGRANMAPRRGPVSPTGPRDGSDAEVAELVDALASGASVRKGVWVQIPSSVPSLDPSDHARRHLCPGGGIGIRVRLRGV